MFDMVAKSVPVGMLILVTLAFVPTASAGPLIENNIENKCDSPFFESGLSQGGNVVGTCNDSGGWWCVGIAGTQTPGSTTWTCVGVLFDNDNGVRCVGYWESGECNGASLA